MWTNCICIAITAYWSCYSILVRNVCLSLCVCEHACTHASIAKWSGHRPSNREVVGSIPSCGRLVLPWPRNFIHICSSSPSCINEDLVLTREAAHPDVTSINGHLVITGEANVKLLSMSANGCGSGGTLGAHTITLGMVQPHLWGTSSSPRWICQHWLLAPE